jgi:predicted polyphosphate/ATP-dependent NAD kinase
MVRGQKLLVGIVANPESGCDVRRLVSCASVFPTSEKVSMVVRVLAALGSFGVQGALMMPDKSGIAAGVLRAILSHSATANDLWPKVQFLEQKIEHTADDTRFAVRAMLNAGVRAIVVLGGDGTHRVVASECGATPLVTLSTGTNNTFPDLREATVAGIAAGLCATGEFDVSEICRRNKRLNIRLDNRHEIALVEVAICRNRNIGSRALWNPEDLSEIFVAFAECDSIGLSSIAGLLRPTSRDAAEGCFVRFNHESPVSWLSAPIAPGLIRNMPIGSVRSLPLGQQIPIDADYGTIALDGEREIEFTAGDNPCLSLDMGGPLTVDVRKTLQLAADRGFLASRLSHPPPIKRDQQDDN